ncbi:MAG: hypothetical protein ABIX28_11195 [Vicinamibacterales bacterium]
MEVFEADPSTLLTRLQELTGAGDVSTIAVLRGQRTIAEFHLQTQVPRTPVGPMIVAVNDLASLLEGCSIRVRRQPTIRLHTPHV